MNSKMSCEDATANHRRVCGQNSTHHGAAGHSCNESIAHLQQHSSCTQLSTNIDHLVEKRREDGECQASCKLSVSDDEASECVGELVHNQYDSSYDTTIVPWMQGGDGGSTDEQEPAENTYRPAIERSSNIDTMIGQVEEGESSRTAARRQQPADGGLDHLCVISNAIKIADEVVEARLKALLEATRQERKEIEEAKHME